MKFSRRFFTIVLFFLSIGLSGCSVLGGLEERRSNADRIARAAGFEKSLMTTDAFLLTVYHKITRPGQPVIIYIEGDGLAWLSRTRLSPNPTPRIPLAFKLATSDPTANVVYLARPCQYTQADLNPKCGPEYWSDKRFSEVVIAAMNQAVDQISSWSNAEKIHLVGFSGGAAVASLLAARRNDVASLRTVAGNLDHVALNRYHRVSPLLGSLNPVDVATAMAHIPQLHFVGKDDDVVPAFVAQEFLKKSGKTRCIRISLVEGASHNGGWAELWPYLLKQSVDCRVK